MARNSVSLQDVAREAGVSPQTVSRVANGSDAVRPATKLKVEAAMEHLGYRPNYAARALKSGHFNNVGVLLSNMSAYGNSRILEGITTAAANSGYSITIRPLDNLQDQSLAGALKLVEGLPLDGAIVIMERDFTDFNQFVNFGNYQAIRQPTCSAYLRGTGKPLPHHRFGLVWLRHCSRGLFPVEGA